MDSIEMNLEKDIAVIKNNIEHVSQNLSDIKRNLEIFPNTYVSHDKMDKIRSELESKIETVDIRNSIARKAVNIAMTLTLSSVVAALLALVLKVN